MAIIKGTTKRGQELLARAKHNEGTELYQIYGSYSAAKGRAMKECKEKCAAVNGYNFRIIGHNGWAFSVAWNFTNSDTGEMMTQIETSSNTYVIDGSRRLTESEVI